MRYVIAFGRFWCDFLIGDRPELFVGPILALAVVALLTRAGWTAANGLLLFGLVVATCTLSLTLQLASLRTRGER
jgi:cobalamin biosynthesis protein CobD/CbiB